MQHGKTHSSKHHDTSPVYGKRPKDLFSAGTLGTGGVGACCLVVECVTPALFSVSLSGGLMCSADGNQKTKNCLKRL